MNQLYLYVALAGVALVLYGLTRTRASKPAAEPQVDLLARQQQDAELKQSLEEFMTELERDNGRLIDSFTDLQIRTQKELADQQQDVKMLERRVADLERQVERAMMAARLEQPAASVRLSEAPPTVEAAPVPTTLEELPPIEALPVEPTPLTERFAMHEKYSRVMELSRQGLSAEQIARETGIGIGEIQLVVGLSKREES